MKELVEVKRQDPVKGSQHVPKSDKGVVWCDDSSIAFGGVIVEDVAWLQKNDVAYINVAELELVNKGIYFALK